MTVETYIDKFYPLAIQVEKKYKIPVLVTLAQSALETGWGESAPKNNFFGIKAGSSWTGETQDILTTEIVTPEQLKKLKSVHSQSRLESGNYRIKIYQKFRAYTSPAQSFNDYGKLLTTNSRYKGAFIFSDPYKFAYEIVKAGYATATNYYSSISNIMDTIKKKLDQVMKATEMNFSEYPV